MIYIHSTGIHNTMPADGQPDLAAELRTLTGKVYRRSDHFIQLAIIGAHKAAGRLDLPKRTALYLTSGQGNISVFARICAERQINNFLPRPVDFINLLSNSAGFYVASHLGLEGKNLFLSHHSFPVQMTMLAAGNEIRLGRQDAVLVGGVDEWFNDQELARRISGLGPQAVMGEGSNWLLLSSEPGQALAAFVMADKVLNSDAVRQLLAAEQAGTWLAFSRRFTAEGIREFMDINKKCRRYCYEDSCGYYQTLPLYVINRFLEEKQGRLIHLDVNEDEYMIMTVDNRGYGA